MKILFILLIFILQFHVHAQNVVAEIAVGQAELDKDKFVLDDFEAKNLSSTQKIIAAELTDILRNDFIFYKHKFNSVEYSDKGKASFSNPQLEKWATEGITYFITSEISSGTSDVIEAKYKAWSVLTKKEILNQTFKVKHSSLRSNAHQIADAIYRSITGKSSIFNSKIVFLSDRTTKGRNIEKELYIMDFDGRRVEKLTDFNSVILSPSVAPDNSRVMFSLIAAKKQMIGGRSHMIKNIDLKSLDLRTRKVTSLSSKPGINSGAIFSASGNEIFLTLSFSGNADIYEMSLANGKMRKVTSHYSDDVDPSVSADGSMMTFLSSRPGRAHIYTMDPSSAEKDIKRISFVGQFNATPRFSPDGKEIVFTSWVDQGFDLYRIDSAGNNLSRLTKDFGSNEEPAFSPDGEFIVFTSKRVNGARAVQDVQIMSREGEILGQLTQDFGRCYSPQWTNLPK